MTNTTDISKELRDAVEDGLGNHTHEFANPWIFKKSYSHEELGEILRDIMASNRLFNNLSDLIQKAVTEARLDELKSLLLEEESDGIGFRSAVRSDEIRQRINRLSNTTGEGK